MLRTISLLLTALAISGTFAQDRPKPPPRDGEFGMFRRMMAAEAKTRYAGTRVVTRNIDGNARREIELVLRDGPRTRVEFPKESPRRGEVIVERGDQQWHWIPAENVVRVGRAKRLERLTEHFPRIIESLRRGDLQLRRNGDARIAGRKCDSFELRKADGTVIWRMGIDDDTGLLLKQETFDPANPRRVLGGFEFTQIDLGVHPTDEDFRIDRPGAKIVPDDFLPLREAQKSVPFRILRPERLPPGFEPVGARPVPIAGRPGVHLLFHDRNGMQPISVFQVRGAVRRGELPGERRGFNTATRQVGEVFVAVVGKLSEERLQAIADSMR